MSRCLCFEFSCDDETVPNYAEDDYLVEWQTINGVRSLKCCGEEKLCDRSTLVDRAGDFCHDGSLKVVVSLSYVQVLPQVNNLLYCGRNREN